MKKTIQKELNRRMKSVLMTMATEKVSQKEPEEWWDEFIFTFVSLKEKQQGENGGEYVSPYTAGNIKKFIKRLLSQQRTQTIEEIRGEFVKLAIDGGNDTQAWKGIMLYSRMLKYLDSLK